MTEPAGVGVATGSSVVIPAHNEGAGIGPCLEAFLRDAREGEFRTYVICNGCSDNTAEIARELGFHGVEVAEIVAPSKIDALNLGDQMCEGVFPRIYLDADVRVTAESLRQVVACLRQGRLACAPVPQVNVNQSRPLVRAYFQIWSRLGYSTTHALGSGLFGLSREGRARFGAFPNVIADDLFVYSQFRQGDRINPPGSSFEQLGPRTLSALARRRARVELGNYQIRELGLRPDVPRPGWRDVIRDRPSLALSGLVYVLVNAYGKAVARRMRTRGPTTSWEPDRTAPEGSGTHAF